MRRGGDFGVVALLHGWERGLLQRGGSEGWVLEIRGAPAVGFPMRHRPLGLAVSAALALSLVLSAPRVEAEYAPKVAVVLCRDTYDVRDMRRYAQMSSQALVGLAGLVGTPYETVMLDELLARPAGTYSSVWFSTCMVLQSATMPALAAFLRAHLALSGSVLLDGPLGSFGPPAAGSSALVYRGSADTAPILNLLAVGWQNVTDWVVRAGAGAHPLASRPGWAAGTVLTQGLASGIEIVRLADGSQPDSHVLLEVAHGAATFPYLVTTRPDGGGGVSPGRVLAISTYANDAGVATPFRNELPRGFFDNLLLPRLVDAATWLLSPDGPSVGLLLSHAPMTAVVRLDADRSDSPVATAAALDHLVRLGRETGVTTAYAIVSAFAQESRWAGFLPLAPELERLGGALASHSHNHPYNMSVELSDPAWDVEVGQSVAIVQSHFRSHRASPSSPPVKVFINPGIGIDWVDYRRFFKGIDTFFTHGFETRVPYTSGVSAFDLPAGTAPVALLGDSPVPDYLWFYEPDWDYRVSEATTYQRQLLRYYQERVGRGALYSQMWHDYALHNAPPHRRPIDQPLATFFADTRAHFARERVYAPGIGELTAKIHLAQRTSLSAQTSAGVVTTALDLSRLTSEQRVHLAGMGLRLHTTRPIVEVTVNGARHPAFSADTIILPPAAEAALTVVAATGDGAAAIPRVTYLSKALATLTTGPGSLRIDLASPGLFTRFCLVPPPGHVVLGADQYAPSGDETCGRLVFGSPAPGFEVSPLPGPPDLAITGSQRRILAVRGTGRTASVDLAAGRTTDCLCLGAPRAPRATVATSAVAPEPHGVGEYFLELGVAGAVTVHLDLDPAPVDRDAAADGEAPDGAATPDVGGWDGNGDGAGVTDASGNDSRADAGDAVAGDAGDTPPSPDAPLPFVTESPCAPATAGGADLPDAGADRIPGHPAPDAWPRPDAAPDTSKDLPPDGDSAVPASDGGCGCQLGGPSAPTGSLAPIASALALALARCLRRWRRPRPAAPLGPSGPACCGEDRRDVSEGPGIEQQGAREGRCGEGAGGGGGGEGHFGDLEASPRCGGGVSVASRVGGQDAGNLR